MVRRLTRVRSTRKPETTSRGQSTSNGANRLLVTGLAVARDSTPEVRVVRVEAPVMREVRCCGNF